ncbi:hypothetical protein TWF281_006743 [Arthrobotrys megalospora]
MGSNITSLPTEILHEILGHPDLDRSDLCHASIVCKSFYHVTKQYIPRDRDIVLRNNRPGQLTSFLRKLLAEPKFGQNFTELNIKWGYAKRTRFSSRGSASDNPGKGEKAEKEFEWTKEELESLGDLAKKYSFHPRWVKSIEGLLDPASLLIPILCLSPQLEELNMGTPVVDSSIEGVYSDCLDAHLEEFIYRLIMDDRKHIQDPEELHAHFPDALKGLKTFSRGDMEDEFGFDIDRIFPIFLLPNIESIELNTLGGDFNLLTRFEDSDYFCKVKHLVLFNLECEAEELARLLRFCEGLETVKIRFEWVDMGIVHDEEEKEEKFDLGVISTVLVQEHKETLKSADVEVERDYWWFKRKGKKWRCGSKPSWWGNEDWGSDEDS